MIRCFSLVDFGTEQNPNKNWISLLQGISLYTDFEILCYPKKIYRDVNGLNFGNNYSGFHNTWIFDFTCTSMHNTDEFEQVLNHIPIICGLNETTNFSLKTILTDTINKNISFLLMNKQSK